jgi:uncharacterized protein (DUF924 family)/glutathione S-transferase
MLIETTHGCGQVPPLLLLLEELGAPYELELRPDGHFLATYGRPGPRLVDDDLTLFEGTTMLRHCARTRAEGRMVPRSLRELARVDAWLDRSNVLGLTVVALRREERERGNERRAQRIAEERAKVSAILGVVERALEDSDGDWLLGDFGLADCALASLPRFAGMLDLGSWPRVRAYCERLGRRPALARVQARLAPASAPTPVSPEHVLEFWFGTPPRTETELMQKAQRWFAGGSAMDTEVRERFSETIEAALAGDLDGWIATPRGRLALVLVLDQFTRNAFRDQPRAFAGDTRARELVSEAFDSGADEGLSVPERLFLSMPLLHAEDTRQLQRVREIARSIAAASPPLFANACAMHIEQADKYLDVVTRFGRFPHRNAALARASTPEEEAFLVDWAEKARPAGAPRPTDRR